jgi:hypothetical protein
MLEIFESERIPEMVFTDSPCSRCSAKSQSRSKKRAASFDKEKRRPQQIVLEQPITPNIASIGLKGRDLLWFSLVEAPVPISVKEYCLKSSLTAIDPRRFSVVRRIQQCAKLLCMMLRKPFAPSRRVDNGQESRSPRILRRYVQSS